METKSSSSSSPVPPPIEYLYVYVGRQQICTGDQRLRPWKTCYPSYNS